MPRLNDAILDCVVYLYPTKHEADEGLRAGGSGFLIRVATTIMPDSHFNFVATNRHVVDGGAKFSRRHLYTLESERKFPKRVPLGENRVGWSESEIDDWIKAKAACRAA